MPAGCSGVSDGRAMAVLVHGGHWSSQLEAAPPCMRHDLYQVPAEKLEAGQKVFAVAHSRRRTGSLGVRSDGTRVEATAASASDGKMRSWTEEPTR